MNRTEGTDDARVATPRRRGWRVWLAGALTVLGVGAALASAAGWLGSVGWVFDLCAHFVVQYAVALVVVAVGLFVARAPRRGGAALALAVPSAVAAWSTCVGGAGGAGAAGAELSIVLTNVLSRNTGYAAVAAWVEAKARDVVVALEVSPAWERELRARLPAYRYGQIVARDDNFGVALIAKVPLEHVRALELGADAAPTLAAEVQAGGMTTTIIATHPVPPMGGAATGRRDEQLAAIAAWVAEHGEREAIVVGDLNATPWSRAFAPLEAAGLHDTRAGFGVQATWPVGMWPLRIPIDHCLASDGWVTVAREVGPDVGSDHFPLFVALARRAP